MKRLLLASALLFLPSAVSAQATVRGISLGTTVRLSDSRLNPGTPVTLTWDATRKEWRGDGNGMTYRLVHEDDFDWFIRADFVSGGTAYSYGLVWQPSTQLRGIQPLVWTGFVQTAGPLWQQYGIADYYQDRALAITVTP